MIGGVTIRLTPRGDGIAAKVVPGDPLPLDRLLIGKPVAEAAALMPRLFNLCRAAQATAAHLALGLPAPDDALRLEAEVLRDHMVKLFLTLPQLLGLSPRPFPAKGTEAGSLFGATGRFPETPAAFDRWLAAGEGVAPVLSALCDRFRPGEAVADLPDVTEATALAPIARENSCALRHAGHPVLDRLAATHGRGPLWRTAARVRDASACLDRALPAPRILTDGTVVTPAARGQYAVKARAEDGCVAAFRRVTPTDHLLAPGGMLTQSFASLPPAKADLSALLIEILDPCLPVSLTQVMESEARDA
ncbi:MAG: hydrogenase expression/formation protein HupK [Paracoccaceae bacterium]|nr:hydrogenase expression/formation protein HupK [Paracoccaceae bacterium]